MYFLPKRSKFATVTYMELMWRLRFWDYVSQIFGSCVLGLAPRSTKFRSYGKNRYKSVGRISRPSAGLFTDISAIACARATLRLLSASRKRRRPFSEPAGSCLEVYGVTNNSTILNVVTSTNPRSEMRSSGITTKPNNECCI